jgi:hypothetical protein
MQQRFEHTGKHFYFVLAPYTTLLELGVLRRETREVRGESKFGCDPSSQSASKYLR